MSGTEGAGSSDASELRWLKAAFVVNVVAFAVAILLIQLDPLQQQANRGYFDSPASELGPVPRPFLPISTLDEAIEIANGRLPVIVGEAFVPFDRGNEYFWGELIWDHDMGNIYYWELNQDDVSVSILATTGDIVDFYMTSDRANGTLSQVEALALGAMYVEMFGGLPHDASTPSVDYNCHFSCGSLDVETGEFIEIDYYHWDIWYDRMKDGLRTDDHIMVSLDPTGRLESYYKAWYMNLQGIGTIPEVSLDEALEIARSVAEGTNVSSIEHVIVRPNGCWKGDDWKFGTDPVPVWRVLFDYNSTSFLAEIVIDDTTGEIVGADWYC